MHEGMKMMGRMGAAMKGGDMMAKAKKDQGESMMEQMIEHEKAEQEMELGR
jgi:hypothetical protein